MRNRTFLKKENNKAITLIALVITIIVLLILAGATIAMLTGENGILRRSNYFKRKNRRRNSQRKTRISINRFRDG